MRKVICGKVILYVITSMTHIDCNIVGFVYSADSGCGRVSCNVALFPVMLHVFSVMLHVFPVMLQETRATLQETRATFHETRATLHETLATLQETPANYKKHVQHFTKRNTCNITRVRRPRPCPPNTQSQHSLCRSTE